MLADISLFSRLFQTTGSASVCNSAAATSLQSYGQARKGADLCEKYIKQLQDEEYVPAELISQLYSSKEKFDTELLNLKQELMEQAAKEPLDMLDREVYNGLTESAQADLQEIMRSDEVFRRALEMKDEAATGTKKEKQPEQEEPVSEESTKDVAEKPAEKADEAVETDGSDEDLGELGGFDDFGSDVESEE